MQLEEFDAIGGDPTSSLTDFTQTNLEFALFHPRYRFEACEVMLSTEGAYTTRCGITATSRELGSISAGVVGCDEFDAVARASDLLAFEVDRRIAELEEPPVVAPRPRMGRRVAPARRPTATVWGLA